MFSNSPVALAAVLTGVFLAPVSLFPVSPAQATPVKPTFSSAKYGFSVWLPAKPQTGKRPFNQPGFPSKSVDFYYISLDQNPVSYTIMPLPLPAPASKGPAGQFYDGVQIGILQSASGRKKVARNITQSGLSARHFEWTFSTPTQTSSKPVKFTGAARIFRKGAMSYQIMALAPDATFARNRTQINKALSSFLITRR